VTRVDIGLKKIDTKTLFLAKLSRTPSREEHKTGFSVLTTIEMNFLGEFTNPVNTGTFNFKKQ
jgi:hypothetical protein